MNWRFMLKYKGLYLILVCFTLMNQSIAQDSTDVNSEKVQLLSVGLTFDYLKLHTLLIDGSEKWEGAVNLRILDKISVIGEYGIAELTPDDAYKNAEYKSEGDYYRVGLDYHFTVIPNNYLFLGVRYAQSNFNENIAYEIGNPIFDNESGEISRTNLTATWVELVLTSEKKVRNIGKKNIPDFLSIGFKLRLKSLQEYDNFDDYEVKNIPGYGQTNIKLNPELNLYLKFRIPIF
ncbi:DUF6048 family protein [Marivirga sp.]|uniref:DUF6048 family protein n=1 Tax=Marivirga sp. TaxID=2018662 RepID=UPI002D7FD627|nr:DUF6048 family protein [Marivirga sp.]HET8859746.1 DUF6048 family protein [Marivirga sp.]